MKETGLMFKAPLVQAILEGRKTQTRRIVKPQPAPDKRFQGWILDSTDRKRIGKASWGHGTGGLVSDIECIGSPCGKPGDRIYVRETWQKAGGRSGIWYAATDSKADDGNSPVTSWRPSIHMPKSAARIWLEITGVRVERLQDISESDALAEGITTWHSGDEKFYMYGPGDASGVFGRAGSWKPKRTPKEAFRVIWESTGGDWAANPWVWVVDFKVLSTTGRPKQADG